MASTAAGGRSGLSPKNSITAATPFPSRTGTATAARRPVRDASAPTAPISVGSSVHTGSPRATARSAMGPAAPTSRRGANRTGSSMWQTPVATTRPPATVRSRPTGQRAAAHTTSTTAVAVASRLAALPA
ncbi:MAG TPA: hypothetical protein VNT52_00175, partial [Acidimicrobiales bacterium]|nr:hypothetical protein [Acidimicrobiales bacterium]